MTRLAEQPAFPPAHSCWSGMTFRQYYAGLAMQALATNDKALLQPSLDLQFSDRLARERYIANVATSLADALIAELEKSKP